MGDTSDGEGSGETTGTPVGGNNPGLTLWGAEMPIDISARGQALLHGL